VDLFSFRGLAYSESLSFLKRRGVAGGVPKAHQAFLVALTGGHPFYLDLLADGLERTQREMGRRAGPERLILEALLRELFAGAGRLQLYFEGLLANSFLSWRAPELYLGMMEAVAKGDGSLAAISHRIRREAPALSRQVQNLLDSGLVAKEGTRYFIPDPLFRLWLRHVYLAKRLPRRLGESGVGQFRRHFEALMADFLSGFEAETVRRIARILSASDGKAPRPSAGAMAGGEEAEPIPRFDQVEMQQKLSEETFDLVARRGNEYWLFAVFEEPPAEADLSEFAERVGRARRAGPEGQSVEAVALALAGLSRSAAKAAERFQLDVWNRQEVNRLAECYGQLPIVG
jgi:hypothetical protein